MRRTIFRSVVLTGVAVFTAVVALFGSDATSTGMRFRAILDRIEGDIAVLAVGDDERERFEIPARFLPPGLREGDVVNVDFTIDVEETRRRREVVKARLDSLLGRRGTGTLRD